MKFSHKYLIAAVVISALVLVVFHLWPDNAVAIIAILALIQGTEAKIAARSRS